MRVERARWGNEREIEERREEEMERDPSNVRVVGVDDERETEREIREEDCMR